jgi:drug/metabolite transporter (DMT)-like permease
MKLVRRPSWVFGTLMLGAAVLCQLAALAFAPLILVQPLGAISLVITTLLNARLTGLKPNRRSIIAIVACVGGIFVFVTLAALFATDTPVSDLQLIIILLLLLVVLVTLVTVWLLVRKKAHPLFYIVASGILYGFVATFAKTIITRLQSRDVNWLTVLCAVGLIAAFAVGAYFVQTAYAVGPPDLVIAGLTVIDPMVAVLIGLTVLQEAASAPLGVFLGFGAAGLVAVFGVFSLARNHPQVLNDSGQVPIERGSDGGAPS